MAYDPNAPGNNPGGTPPPNTPYGPTNYGAPPPPPPGPSDPYQSQQPYNPYAPSTPSYPPVPNNNSAPAYPSQPGISGAGYNDPTYVSPSAQGYQAPPVQPGPSYPGYPPVNQGYPQPGFVPPPQKKSSGGKIALIILAVVVVLAGIGIFSASAYNTSQGNAHATATADAQTQAQHATATANVQATATYTASHFPFSTKLLLDDSLNGNNPAHGWMSDNYCSFRDNMYHASETKASTFVTCSAKSTDYTDFSFEATMQSFIGNAGGLVFRGNEDQQNYYLFMVFYDGSFGFYSYSTASHTKKIITGNVDNFSMTKPIRLGVTAQGNAFKFFANGQQIGEATDSTYSHGQVGVVVDNDALITSANFSNAKVWQL